MFAAKVITRLYLLIISIFSICRLILLYFNIDLIPSDFQSEILNALLLGLRFDIVISGYILVPSFIYLSITDFINKRNRLTEKIHFIYLIAVPGMAFFISAANIPYFMQFFQHINSAIFIYFDEYNYVLKMIVGEYRYWMYAVLFVLLMFAYIYILNKILKLHSKRDQQSKITKQIVISILFLGLMLVGIRGRIEGKSPIRIGTTSFTNNSFLNKLGLNPNFTLLSSTILAMKQGEIQTNFMDEDEAMKIVLEELQVDNLERRIEYKNEKRKSNVVLILMESMGASKMGRFGNTDGLTPFLDSIANYGYSFDRTYTAGIHTFNGVFSTLYSIPSAYNYHPMKQSYGKGFTGLPNSLKELGYHTSFFTTHDGQFDNTEGFLYENGFDEIISLDDYPENHSLSNLGVPDDYMFEFGIEKIDEIAKNNSNFLAVFLTASDHGPYVIPDYFTPNAEGIKKQIVQYADWSLKQLIDKASKHSWYDNTYFVFIADHGSWDRAVYQMPLAYHHSPFIIYAPSLIDSAIAYSNLTSQMDLYPTIMGVMEQTYTNQSLGIDARKVNRNYVYFTSDESLGILDEDYFFYFDKHNSQFLYKYNEKDLTNYAPDRQEKVKELETVLKAHFQVSMEVLGG